MVKHAQKAGFTLLELLVAVGVLGMLLVGLTDGVRLGMSGWNAQSRQIAASQELDSTDRLFRSLLNRISLDRTKPLYGTQTTLSITALLPIAAAPQLRRADISLMVTQDHRLVMRWLPASDKKQSPPPDQPSGPTPNESEILRNVASAEFAYLYDGPANKDTKQGWQPDWPGSAIPSLVRMRLVFLPADPRHWPDIVAATIVQKR